MHYGCGIQRFQEAAVFQFHSLKQQSAKLFVLQARYESVGYPFLVKIDGVEEIVDIGSVDLIVAKFR